MEIPPPPAPSVAESLKDLPSVETRAYLLYRETHIGVALVQTIVELTKKRGLISSAMEIRLLGEFDKVIQRLIVGSRLAEEPQMAFYPEQLVAFRNKDNTYTLFFRNVRVFQLFSFATVKNFLDLQVVLNEGKPLPKQKNVDSGRRTVNNPPKHSDSVEVLVEEVAAMKVTAYTPFNRIAQNRRASGKSAGTIVTFDENYDHKKEYYVVCGGETTDGAAVKEKKLSSRDRNILQKRQKAEEDAHRYNPKKDAQLLKKRWNPNQREETLLKEAAYLRKRRSDIDQGNKDPLGLCSRDNGIEGGVRSASKIKYSAPRSVGSKKLHPGSSNSISVTSTTEKGRDA